MNGFQTRYITQEKLPLVIEPLDRNITYDQFLNLLKSNNAYLKKELLKHGGLLLRNFPVNNANDFANVIRSLGTGQFIDYIGGDSPRDKINDAVYTSTEAPPSFRIPLHNELSYVKNFPKHIYFYCEIAPIEKGETIIADARKVYQDMDQKILQKFIEKGIKYTSCYYDKSALMDFINKFQRSHKRWESVFETDSKDEVERKCRENEFGFKWNKNDWLEITQERPAVITHPITKEKVWFNQAHLFDLTPKMLGWWRYIAVQLLYMRKYTRLHDVSFGDRTPIPREDLYKIMDVLDANTIYFPWHKGDVLILDNVLAMHGRAAFSGKRRILTAMTS